jgi:triacylglycerol lipase
MSTLVELPPNEYDLAAFDDFHPEQSNFTINNARAMMWFSQLAYETGKPETIEFVRSKFDFTSVFPFVKSKVGTTAIFETCGIIGERPNAVVLAFAGTDPLVWENLTTDVDIQVTDRNTHRGFQDALNGVLAEVDQAIQASQEGGKPLFIAGHSLGRSPRLRHNMRTIKVPRQKQFMYSACRAREVKNSKRITTRSSAR